MILFKRLLCKLKLFSLIIFIILISSRLILVLCFFYFFIFFLICPAEIAVRLIHSCVLYAVKHSNSMVSYHHQHHHHVMPQAQISLTLSRHFSQSFIASGRSSGLHPVSSQSCCMYVLAGRPAFARPYVGVHRITSLMSSSLLLQQCPACLVRLTWMVFVMRGRWPYSFCFVGCCLQDLIMIIIYPYTSIWFQGTIRTHIVI